MNHSVCFVSLRSLAVLSVCALLVAGCAMDGGVVDPYDARARREAAGQRTDQMQAGAAQRDVLIPVMSSINSRIRACEKKIEEWKEVERKTATMSLPQEKLNRIDECRSHLQHILLEYTSLQKQLQDEPQIEAAQVFAGTSLLRLNQQDIEYLESGCVKFLTELKAGSQPTPVMQADPQIKAAYENRDYDQVINLYSRAVATSGQMMAAETTYQYGQALIKNYQEVEARRVLADLLPKVRSQKGQDELQLHLLQKVADLNFSLESFEDARRQYEELIQLSIEKGASRDEWAGLQLAALQSAAFATPEFKEYTVLLRKYLAFVPRRDGYNVAEQADRFLTAYPASTMAANVNLMKRSTREQLDAWLNQGIKRVESQVEERKTAEVPETDRQVPVSSVTQDQAVTGAAASGTVAPVIGVNGEKNLQEEYDRGVAHLQAREYDKAIERFDRLKNTALEAQAQPHMQEASRLAAQDVRQKAAELFVRATNSRDTDEKRKLLLSSRDLLQSILVRYPQSGLIDRVQKNLVRIEAELQAVGTGLMPRPVTSGGAYAPSGSGIGGETGKPPASL